MEGRIEGDGGQAELRKVLPKLQFRISRNGRKNNTDLHYYTCKSPDGESKGSFC